jgi:RNA polymerase primary sigma factor
MKVSRAKERALMREFGLDETTLTEEEVAKRRQELKTLIKMGKTRGFLTHQEINDHLPEKLVNEEILEAIVSMLNDMGIAVYEQAPDAATLLIAGSGTTTATEEEAEEAAEAACPPSTASSAAPPTRCACTCARWARWNCSRAKARSRSPSASKAACRP